MQSTPVPDAPAPSTKAREGGHGSPPYHLESTGGARAVQSTSGRIQRKKILEFSLENRSSDGSAAVPQEIDFTSLKLISMRLLLKDG